MFKMPKTIICITGVIGSGKSLVTNYLRKLGYPVFDLDDCVKRLYQDKKIIQQINKMLFQQNHDTLNIHKIRELIFQDTEKKMLLEQFLYPLVKQQMDHFCHQYAVSFVEMALVFEKKWDHYFDEILCINSEISKIQQRLMQNRKLTLQDITKILKHQYSNQYKKEHATYVIENNTTIDELYANVDQYLKKRGLYGTNKN